MVSAKRILIVDDNEDFLTVNESRLNARHYIVQCAPDAETAFKMLRETPPDMVLVGSGIWKDRGHEICVHVRGSLGASTTPIILMVEPDEIPSLLISLDKGLDDFILKPFTPLEIQLRVTLNFQRNEERIQANPLTKLPGNVSIDKEIRRRIDHHELFSVCYIDIDNFKAYNDAYGFDRGDDVLLQTANIIRRAASELDPRARAFVGHIGGDDFLVILDPKYDHLFAKECIREFDRIMPTYYKAEDQKRGSITVKNRKGRMAKIPIMSLSIAAVSNENRRLESLGHIAQAAAEVKEYLKTQPGSNFLRDRREQQIRDIDMAATMLAEDTGAKAAGKNSEPLGQVLVAAGLLSPEQLTLALERHFHTGQRLGQVLISMNLCKSEDVGRMLERKLGVTYVSLANRKLPAALARLFTGEFVRTHRVSPIEIKDKILLLAMIDPYDLKVIDYIERITGYKVAPCIALETEFEAFLDRNFNADSFSEAAGAL